MGKDGGLFDQKVKSSEVKIRQIKWNLTALWSSVDGGFFFLLLIFLHPDHNVRPSGSAGCLDEAKKTKKNKPWPLSRPLRFSFLHQVCNRVHAKAFTNPLKRPLSLLHHQLASISPQRGFEVHVRGIIEEAWRNFHLFFIFFSKSDIPEPQPDSMVGFYI